jgi:argininosuccinate lyase
MKLWGGRFSGGRVDPQFERFSESFSVDQRLVHYDLRVNQVYVKALGAAGVLRGGEVRRLTRGLQSIARRVEGDRNWSRGESAEDVHTWVEMRLEREIGPLARKLRTGRSRNDLVATETRLYAKSEVLKLQSAIFDLVQALLALARRHAKAVMPAYTHLQPAQPVLFSHYLLAYYEMLLRDFERLENCRDRADELPLGAGAVAGSAFSLDREALARELGFTRVARNSADATSDRDFVCELLFCCALAMTHLSRLAEDLTIYSSPNFGYVELADAYSTGSSIMPQKKNPDSLELIRGKAAGVLGRLTGMLALMKGLPLAYDRDLQEDKAALFEVGDTTRESLALAARVLATLQIHSQRMQSATELGFLTATEIADELVRRGLPFAEAHEQVGRLVRYCSGSTPNAQGRGSGRGPRGPRTFADLSHDEARRYIPLWNSKLRQIAISPQDATRRRNVIGGTAPGQVARQLRAAERKLTQLKRALTHA